MIKGNSLLHYFHLTNSQTVSQRKMKIAFILIVAFIVSAASATVWGLSGDYNSDARQGSYRGVYNNKYINAKSNHGYRAKTNHGSGNDRYKPNHSSAAPAAYHHEEYEHPAHYRFEYEVNDDYSYVDMGQTEEREGDLTTGNYHVVLPDGRKQNVDYYVDGYSGFVADVQYEGEPHHDYDNSNYQHGSGGYKHRPAAAVYNSRHGAGYNKKPAISHYKPRYY